MLKGKLLKNVKAAFDAHAKGDEPAVAVEDLVRGFEHEVVLRRAHLEVVQELRLVDHHVLRGIEAVQTRPQPVALEGVLDSPIFIQTKGASNNCSQEQT